MSPPAQPASWWLQTRGLRLKIWDLGADSPDPGAPEPTPVICLHSWLGQGLDWWPVVHSRPGRWLCPDQRGFGASDHVGAGGYYHFMDMLPDVDALIDALGGGPVDLVGHSMGGTVASCYAGARPQRVRRLVVVEGLGALGGAEPSQLARTRRHLAAVREHLRPSAVTDTDEAAKRLRRHFGAMTAEHAALIARNGLSHAAGTSVWAWDPLHRVPGPYPFREPWYAEFLAAITAPTLVVWGSESWYPPDVQARRSAYIAGCAQQTLTGGHMLNVDAPQALGAAIHAHLTEPQSGAR